MASQSPLVYDGLLVFPYLSWPWQCWGVVAKLSCTMSPTLGLSDVELTIGLKFGGLNKNTIEVKSPSSHVVSVLRISSLGYPNILISQDINIHLLVMVVFITFPHLKLLFFSFITSALEEWFNVLKGSFDHYFGNWVDTRRQLGGWRCKQGEHGMLLTGHFSGMNPHVN